MNRIRHRLFTFGRELRTRSYDGPSEALKRKVAELEKTRKMRTSRKKDQFFVEVPESKSYLDTATPQMVLAVVGIALFAKFLMMVFLTCASPSSPILLFLSSFKPFKFIDGRCSNQDASFFGSCFNGISIV